MAQEQRYTNAAVGDCLAAAEKPALAMDVPENDEDFFVIRDVVVSIKGIQETKSDDDDDDDQMARDGAMDMRGRPSIKSKSGNWRASAFIFGCEASERVGFNAISANLVGYLTTAMREDLSMAVKNANNWCGTVRLTPIIAAIVADSYLGRFMTICVFMSVYLLGEVLVTTSVTMPSLKPPECRPGASCPPPTGTQVAIFYCALYVIALGAGGSRACVFPFAGDQFDEHDRSEAQRKLSKSNWYFIALTSGNLVGVTGVVYAQARLGWAWGYGLAAATTALCGLAFLAAAPRYRHQPVVCSQAQGSPLTRVAQVLVAAARNWNVPDPSGRAPRIAFLDKASTRMAQNPTLNVGAHPEAQQDPWKQCPTTQVEEVKMLARMVPIWVTNIMFWVVYAQVSTLFLNQGTTLNRHVGRGEFQIPAASMPLFLHLSICVCLPVYGKFVVPLARRFTGKHHGFTELQRIGLGQALSLLPITVAALMEVRRLRLVHSLNHGPDQQPLPMSIFWLLPQYALMGFTEVFLSVGQIEFFTNQAPPSMRSLGSAMASSAVALGNFGSSVLVDIVTKLTNSEWIQNNVNESRIDYFYWLLTVLTVMNLGIYLFFARRYNRDQNHLNGQETRVSGKGATSGMHQRVHPVNAVDVAL